MSIVRVGTNKKYAEGWASAFSGKTASGKTAKNKKTAVKKSAKKSAKKAKRK